MAAVKGKKTSSKKQVLEYFAPNGEPSNLTHEQWHLVRTPEFKSWFGEWENDPENSSKILDSNNEPLVIFHGTTHEFYEFERTRGNVENHFGVGYYFTDSKADVENNYLEEGADLTNRIEQMADRLENDGLARAKAKKKAEKLLKGTKPKILHVFLKMLNPIYLTDNGTRFDSLEIENEDGDYVENEDSLPMKLFNAMQSVQYEFDGVDAQKIFNDIGEELGYDWDYVLAKSVDEALRKSESLMYIQDSEGNLASNEYIRRVYEEAGFDGIVMDADSQFGNKRKSGKKMLMDEGTRHYISFESNNIKLADGKNTTFDPENNDVRFEKGGNLSDAKNDTMDFWHGGNLDDYDDNIAQKNGRYEYGAGLYLTTNYDTAKKYAKGSRKLYLVTVKKGVDIRDALIDLKQINEFVKNYIIGSKRKEVLQRIEKYTTDSKVKAFVFNNIILNEKAIKSTNTKNLREFYIKNNIDYEIVDNAFGWGEEMMVLYNMDKIVSKKIIKSTDTITDYNINNIYKDGGNIDSLEEEARKLMLELGFDATGELIPIEEVVPLVALEDGGNIEETIALPDSYSSYEGLKSILNTQGYDISKIEKEDDMSDVNAVVEEESIKDRFELSDATTTKEIDENINEILSQYSSRTMAAIQCESYLRWLNLINPDIAKAYLAENNINGRFELADFLSKKQVKVRSGKGIERRNALSEIENEKTNFNVSEIEKLALNASKESDEKIEEDELSKKKKFLDDVNGLFGEKEDVEEKSVILEEPVKEKKYSLWMLRYSDRTGSGWHFDTIDEAVQYAKNKGVIGDSGYRYEIRDRNNGKLLLGKGEIKKILKGDKSIQDYTSKFEEGGNIPTDEYEIKDYLTQENNEAESLLLSNQTKIAKAMICTAKMNVAEKRINETESAIEKNAWQEVKNIWEYCLLDIKNNFCNGSIEYEMEDGGRADCGCGHNTKFMSKGGLAYGNSHDKGGMPLVVKSTGQNIEIEGAEGVVNKRSMQMDKKVEFEGKQMTPCEAVSKINEMGGGVKFKCDDVKEIVAKDGNF